jgi:hypothetical protein
VPDCVRAFLAKKPILVRNPSAVRPWQHVLECLSGYLWLGARLAKEPKTSPLAGAFNFGPESNARQPVRTLVQEVLKIWPAEWTDGSGGGGPHEAKLLTLSIEKAGVLLGWHPTWEFQEAVARTIAWYYERREPGNWHARFLQPPIDDYAQAARPRLRMGCGLKLTHEFSFQCRSAAASGAPILDLGSSRSPITCFGRRISKPEPVPAPPFGLPRLLDVAIMDPSRQCSYFQSPRISSFSDVMLNHAREAARYIRSFLGKDSHRIEVAATTATSW